MCPFFLYIFFYIFKQDDTEHSEANNIENAKTGTFADEKTAPTETETNNVANADGVDSDALSDAPDNDELAYADSVDNNALANDGTLTGNICDNSTLINTYALADLDDKTNNFKALSEPEAGQDDSLANAVDNTNPGTQYTFEEAAERDDDDAGKNVEEDIANDSDGKIVNKIDVPEDTTDSDAVSNYTDDLLDGDISDDDAYEIATTTAGKTIDRDGLEETSESPSENDEKTEVSDGASENGTDLEQEPVMQTIAKADSKTEPIGPTSEAVEMENRRSNSNEVGN